MKFNNSNIDKSGVDIISKIKLPNNLTPKLAYLIGVHIGDGSMNYNLNKRMYWVSYTGHLIDEYDWYIFYIKPLIKFLFNKEVKIRRDERFKRSSINLYFYSKAILTFLNKKIGLPLGIKKDLEIPKIIRDSNKDIKRNFLIGLADTDFCLTFKKRNKKYHYYPVIEYSTPDERLIDSISKLIEEFGIKGYNLRNYDIKRKNTKLITNHLEINGEKNLNKWMSLIGFRSSKHLTKFNIWKKHGFCPPNTNIIERQKILKGEIDINSYYGPVA